MAYLFKTELIILLFSSLVYLVSIIIWFRSYFSDSMYNMDIHLVDVQEVNFKLYMKQFSKIYEEDEYIRRLRNFKASLKEIKMMNAIENAQVYGWTRFTDWSKEEFVKRMGLSQDWVNNCSKRSDKCGKTKNNKRKSFKKLKRNSQKKFYSQNETLPLVVDWRKTGYVSPALDQKQCLGCWAFSVVSVMETMAVKRGFPRDKLSVQELLDCSTHTSGCGGGNIRFALEDLCEDRMRITTEDNYPLTLSMKKNCRKTEVGRRISKFKITCNNHKVTNILRKIVQGPIIAIVACGSWVNYVGGIIQRSCKRQPFETYTHAVSIVGYDTSGDVPYYIIKNSWGDDWGNNGYVYVKMGDNVCNIEDQIATLDIARD